MDQNKEQPSVDWGDISDAELLSLQSEHLAPYKQANVSGDAQSPCRQNCEEIPKRKADYISRFNSRQRKDLSIPNIRPMDRFFKSHLNVTQLCDHSWCEIKMVYGLIKPLMRKKEMQRTEVTTGVSIHLARELKAHPSVVTLPVVTREDKEAVQYLNMLQKIQAIHAGKHVREFQVFGVLEGVFLTGIVDDLQRSDSGELVLSDLKTRKHNSFPGSSQTKGHFFQVGLYKLLFDSMVCGQLDRDQVILYLQSRNLQPQRALDYGIQEQAKTMGYPAVTLGELLDVLLAVLASSNIRGVDKLLIEYYHQNPGGLIGIREVEFQEVQLKAELRGYLAYWRGEREPRGVDIEDAWKCKMCPYEEICDWRKGQSQKEVLEKSNKKAKLDYSNINILVTPVFASDALDSPKLEGSNLDPVVHTQKLDPVVDILKLDPVVDTLKPDPVVHTLKLDPVVDILKQDPVVDILKQDPVVHTLKQDPVVNILKLDPVVDILKLDPVVDILKQDPVVDTLKQDPVVHTLKQDPVVDILKLDPVVDILKQDPVVHTLKQDPVVDILKSDPVVDILKSNPVVDILKLW